MSKANNVVVNLSTAFGAGILFIGTVIVIAPLNTAFGCLSGWIVGWFFGDYLLNALAHFGVHNVTMAQLGALGGFSSAFLRTSVSSKKEN